MRRLTLRAARAYLADAMAELSGGRPISEAIVWAGRAPFSGRLLQRSRNRSPRSSSAMAAECRQLLLHSNAGTLERSVRDVHAADKACGNDAEQLHRCRTPETGARAGHDADLREGGLLSVKAQLGHGRKASAKTTTRSLSTVPVKCNRQPPRGCALRSLLSACIRSQKVREIRTSSLNTGRNSGCAVAMKCGSTAMPKPAMVALSWAIRLALRNLAEIFGETCRQVVEFRREQQFLDVADEAMLAQVGARGNGGRLRRDRRVQHRARVCSRVACGRRCGLPWASVRLIAMSASRLRVRTAVRWRPKLQIEIGIPFCELHQPRGLEVVAEAVGRADPHRAGEMRARAARPPHWLATMVDSIASALSATRCPALGRQIAGLAAIKQFCGEMTLQPVDTPDHCGMIDAELLGGS